MCQHGKTALFQNARPCSPTQNSELASGSKWSEGYRTDRSTSRIVFCEVQLILVLTQPLTGPSSERNRTSKSLSFGSHLLCPQIRIGRDKINIILKSDKLLCLHCQIRKDRSSERVGETHQEINTVLLPTVCVHPFCPLQKWVNAT